MEEKPICAKCGERGMKNGTTSVGSQRYRCKNKHSWTVNPLPRGNDPEGPKAMTGAERVRNYRRRKAEEQRE